MSVLTKDEYATIILAFVLIYSTVLTGSLYIYLNYGWGYMTPLLAVTFIAYLIRLRYGV